MDSDQRPQSEDEGMPSHGLRGLIPRERDIAPYRLEYTPAALRPHAQVFSTPVLDRYMTKLPYSVEVETPGL